MAHVIWRLPCEQQNDAPTQEPDNPYDQHACKAMVKGRLLGYLARDISTRLAPAVDMKASTEESASPTLALGPTEMVGGPGFEPGTSRSRTVRAADLR